MNTGKTGPLPSIDVKAAAEAARKAAAEAARRAAEEAARKAAEAQREQQARMAQDAMKLSKPGAAPSDAAMDGLPWEQGKPVGQFWDHSCGAATVQQAWAEQDPAAYNAARQELESTGSVTLANGETVTLTKEEQQYVNENFPEGDRGDAMMQYAVMKHAQAPVAEGTPPELVANGQAGDSTGGMTQSQIERANAATANMPMVNTSELTTRADDGFIEGNLEESGMTSQELRTNLEENRAAMQLRQKSEENGGGGVLITMANDDGTAHVVTATPQDDGTILVQDGDNPPQVMSDAEFQAAVDGQQGSGTWGSTSSGGTSTRTGRP